MTDFNKLASYEAIRDPSSGAIVFTGSGGLQQAKVRKKLAEERQREQELIRSLAKAVRDLQQEVIALQPPEES